MSEAQVQALYEQLCRLRGLLPEFLQNLTSLDDINSSQEAFFTVAKSLSAWTAETKSLVSTYEQLKPEMETLRELKPQSVKEEQPEDVDADQQDFNFNGLDTAAAGIDTFSNDFFDLT